MKTVAGLICSVMLLALHPTRPQSSAPKETFASARLAAGEIREILAGVERSAYDTPDSWATELRVMRVNLGVDPGIVLQGTNLLCGATGNCQVFVFRKTQSHWVSLFGPQEAPIGESFQFGPGLSHGIKDFTLVTNTSAQAADRVTYAFDGRRYRRRRSG